MNNKKKKRGLSPVAFLAGSAIGAAAAYFFLTEKGKAQRKEIADAARDYSSRIAEQVNGLKQKAFASQENEGTDQPVLSHAGQESSGTQQDKAHNMVSHLKKVSTDTPGTEPV